MVWKPQRTIEECNRILTAPGSLLELETCVIDGRVQRVYKNLWPSMHDFWTWACHEHSEKLYIVYGKQRYTFQQMLERSVKAASMLRNVYQVSKGDRVAICSRNYPEYLVAFWACHLLGAVTVMVNAWLPLEGLIFCMTHTECKVVIVDSERADVLESSVPELTQALKLTGVLVLESHEGKGAWVGMPSWNLVLDEYRGDAADVLTSKHEICPEDNAAIYFTSGTTGRPKGVLSTQRQYLTNVLNTLVAAARDILRKEEEITPPPPGIPQKAILISVPFFHVTGSTSHAMSAAFNGFKIVLMRRWSVDEAIKLIKQENVAIAGGVPSMASDLADVPGLPLETLTFGGAPAPETLAPRVRSTLPNTSMSQGYGMTETNSVAVSIVGADYEHRPTCSGLATLVNDLMIMNLEGTKAVPAGSVGEVWMKGINIMQGYWRDPEATNKVMTRDGWLRSGDLGYMDEEGFLYIKDRLKDIIIRGGENIDSVTVENAIYASDLAIQEAAAVGVPDRRLGELVAVVASLKPGFKLGQITEDSIIAGARKILPRFAVPVMVLLQEQPLEHTPSGKIIKGKLRKLAREEWEKRACNKRSETKL